MTKRTLDPSALSPAAIMVLLYPKNGSYHVLLNRRSQAVEHHKGEISFPGGAKDPEDKDMLHTALRETSEEMGVAARDVTVLGEMSDVATISGFVITPFVGSIPSKYRFTLSREEIDELIEVPLSALLDPQNWREEIRVNGRDMVKAFSYAYNGLLIYGATARILDEFVHLFKGANKELFTRIPGVLEIGRS